MKNNKLSAFLLGLVTAIPGVLAQSRNPLSSVFEAIANFFTGLAEMTWTLPVPPYTEVTFLSMFVTWIIMFVIIFLGSKKIPIFKDQEAKGPRNLFAVAVSILVTFLSPAAHYIQEFVLIYTSSLILWALIALGIAIAYGIWASMRKSIGESSLESAEGYKLGKQAAKIKSEAKINHKNVKQNEKIENKIRNKEKEAIRDLENAISSERSGFWNGPLRTVLKNILGQLENLQMLIAAGNAAKNPRAQQLMKTLATELSNVISLESKAKAINNEAKKQINRLIMYENADQTELLKLRKEINQDHEFVKWWANEHYGSEKEQAAIQSAISDIDHAIMDVKSATKYLQELQQFETKQGNTDNFDKYYKELVTYLRAGNINKAVDAVRQLIKEDDQHVSNLMIIEDIEKKINNLNLDHANKVSNFIKQEETVENSLEDDASQVK